MRTSVRRTHAAAFLTLFLVLPLSHAGGQNPMPQGASAPAESYWHAPDRAAKVLALRPGAGVPNLTSEALFRDWTHRQVQRWRRENPDKTIESVCEAASAGTARLPSDRELTEEFPVHISPYGRLHSGGTADPSKMEKVLTGGAGAVGPGYCPFCGSFDLRIEWDAENRHHAWTSCCERDLYEKDYPENYDLRPNASVDFLHLDETVKTVPAVLYKDADGLVWELFIPTLFACKRWEDSIRLTVDYMNTFKDTADPAYAYKLAVLLDKTADTYFGLPPAWCNELATGKDGKPLTREEWESIPRPSIAGPCYLGPWNRRMPLMCRGWLRLSQEAAWAEPFARVRHHPAFKYYSEKRYDDPNALDHKVRKKLMREIALTWEATGEAGLVTDYQDAIYTSEMFAAVLADRPALIDFTVPSNEATLYNHHYHDGLCDEGAANYMRMPGRCYYPVLSDPQGVWLEIYPNFLKERPFFKTASTEFTEMLTVRGLELEFGDEHIYAFNRAILTTSEEVTKRQAVPSRNWPGWGIGILRVGGPGHRQEVTLSYTRAAQHTCSDQLGVACWFDGIPIMRPGGYAGSHVTVPLQFARPEVRALNDMGYPKEIVDAQKPWAWEWGHSPIVQNTVAVDDTFASIGWQDNRGFGEPIAFKGGETPDEPGAHFQVLEARDRYSFDRVGVPVSEFRRVLIGVEGPDGRPYVVDILTLEGGKRHALFNSAWAERAEVALPPVQKRLDSLLEFMKPENTVNVLGDMMFPKEWTCFGPLQNTVAEADITAMTQVPEELTAAADHLTGRTVTFDHRNRLDLGALVGDGDEGRTLYVMATVAVDEDMTATFGAGADRAMKWWINGLVVCDTSGTGNEYFPPAINDHIFNANLHAGENLIVAKLVVGMGKRVLVAGGPRELRQHPVLVNRGEHLALERVNNCGVLAQAEDAWSITWDTDYAAYAPRDPQGGPFVRPLPEDIGKVSLRFFGLPLDGQKSQLVQAQGPWISIIRQPLSDGGRLNTNVGFSNATDLLIETNETDQGQASSRFVHVLEGYRQDEDSIIGTVCPIPLQSGNRNQAIALEVTRTDGITDIVIYQAEPGQIKLANGLVTDARYSLSRFDAEGIPVEAHVVSGSYLRGRGLNVNGPAAFTGTIVDMVGDLTGTRLESAFIIRPDNPWPPSIPSGCSQLIIEGENTLRCDFRESYSVDRVTPRLDGTLRLDLSFTAPLSCGWHQVMELGSQRPGFFRTNRPMMLGSETPWYAGMTVWFPRLDKTYIFEDLVGGFHQCTEAVLANRPDLAADGIEVGDWFVIHFLHPGMKVTLHNVLIWRK